MPVFDPEPPSLDWHSTPRWPSPCFRPVPVVLRFLAKGRRKKKSGLRCFRFFDLEKPGNWRRKTWRPKIWDFEVLRFFGGYLGLAFGCLGDCFWMLRVNLWLLHFAGLGKKNRWGHGCWIFVGKYWLGPIGRKTWINHGSDQGIVCICVGKLDEKSTGNPGSDQRSGSRTCQYTPGDRLDTGCFSGWFGVYHMTFRNGALTTLKARSGQGLQEITRKSSHQMFVTSVSRPC